MEIENLRMTIINGTFVKGFNFYYLNIIQVLSLKIFVFRSILPITWIFEFVSLISLL